MSEGGAALGEGLEVEGGCFGDEGLEVEVVEKIPKSRLPRKEQKIEILTDAV
jgi:hypothetical protein